MKAWEKGLFGFALLVWASICSYMILELVDIVLGWLR